MMFFICWNSRQVFLCARALFEMTRIGRSCQVTACHSSLFCIFFVAQFSVVLGARIVFDEDNRVASTVIPSSPNSDPVELNDRTLIAILSQRGGPAQGEDSYIAASYVKFVESAGARAVPIFCDMPRDEVERRWPPFKHITNCLLTISLLDCSIGNGHLLLSEVGCLWSTVSSHGNQRFFALSRRASLLMRYYA